jgi:hypothetical protein
VRKRKHDPVTLEQINLKPGDSVAQTDDVGQVHIRSVISEPWQLGGHTWVVMLSDVRGAYALSRCHPVRNEP